MRRFSVALASAATFAAASGLSAQTTISARGADITIGGRLHAQYASSSVGSYKDEFFLRRSRLLADITVNDFLDARLQQEFSNGGVGLKDAYVRLRFSPAFEVTMGQFKRAFDLFELSSTTDLSLIERDGRVGGVSTCDGVGGVCAYSRFTEKLEYSDRDQGLRIQGERGRVGYEVTVTNGTGTTEPEENDAKSFSGRLTYALSSGLTVAANYALHDYPGEGDDDEYGRAWAADLQYGGWRDGLLVQAALVGGDNWKKLGGGGAAASFLAFQGVASYYAAVDDRRFAGVEPLVRLSYGDPDTSLDDDGGIVFTPGLMLYVSGRNKIGANLDVWSPQAGGTEYSLKIQSFVYF